jgi:uncharacterized protein YjbI with pentapeptide repeats
MATEQPDLSEENAAMANQEHIAVLEQGNGAWHQWRKNNPDAIPELRGAELDKMGLSGVDLHDADLRGASLKLADLRKANFSGANLSGADLRKSRLTKANVTKADMHGTDLRKANLRGTDLKVAKGIKK